ncbi:hypothetical protein V6N11_065574 [Hibiscus sabdariffa]|uniref:Uncharacterized protein n=1 Tax=Hibiscus sabdariffa TaxID=183260 RepID=A0ABR2PHU3_9ROSI
MGGVSKDENLTAFLVNGDEESNKKVCSLGHDENMAVGNSLGIQKVISVEKVGQENTRVDGSGIGPIGVSSIQSGHEVQQPWFCWEVLAEIVSLDHRFNSVCFSFGAVPMQQLFDLQEMAPIGVVLFRAWCRGCRLKWLELLGAAPVDVAVLLASWEVCSWSRSGLFAAFIDDGFFAVSWKEVLLLHGAK